jgi:hypothetical protein
VLLNVTKERGHAVKLAESFDGTELLVDLMQMFRDKKQIFVLSCELLSRLVGGNSRIKVDCNKLEMKKRLDGIFHIMQRKGKLESKVNFISSKKDTATAASNSPCPVGLTTPLEHMTVLMSMLEH